LPWMKTGGLNLLFLGGSLLFASPITANKN